MRSEAPGVVALSCIGVACAALAGVLSWPAYRLLLAGFFARRSSHKRSATGAIPLLQLPLDDSFDALFATPELRGLDAAAEAFCLYHGPHVPQWRVRLHRASVALGLFVFYVGLVVFNTSVGSFPCIFRDLGRPAPSCEVDSPDAEDVVANIWAKLGLLCPLGILSILWFTQSARPHSSATPASNGAQHNDFVSTVSRESTFDDGLSYASPNPSNQPAHLREGRPTLSRWYFGAALQGASSSEIAVFRVSTAKWTDRLLYLLFANALMAFASTAYQLYRTTLFDSGPRDRAVLCLAVAANGLLECVSTGVLLTAGLLLRAARKLVMIKARGAFDQLASSKLVAAMRSIPRMRGFLDEMGPKVFRPLERALQWFMWVAASALLMLVADLWLLTLSPFTAWYAGGGYITAAVVAVLVNFALVWRLWSNLEAGLTALTVGGRDLTPSWAGVKTHLAESLAGAGDVPSLAAVEPVLAVAESLGFDHVAFIRRALATYAGDAAFEPAAKSVAARASRLFQDAELRRRAVAALRAPLLAAVRSRLAPDAPSTGDRWRFFSILLEAADTLSASLPSPTAATVARVRAVRNHASNLQRAAAEPATDPADLARCAAALLAHSAPDSDAVALGRDLAALWTQNRTLSCLETALTQHPLSDEVRALTLALFTTSGDDTLASAVVGAGFTGDVVAAVLDGVLNSIATAASGAELPKKLRPLLEGMTPWLPVELIAPLCALAG